MLNLHFNIKMVSGGGWFNTIIIGITGIKYMRGKALSSAVAMDKAMSKFFSKNMVSKLPKVFD
ncbi:MAG: hypothetical protein IPH11_10285 [Ignavibacteriales bacterium]|nr:hypothetical protein [Ignavibacteriales bacterium]